MRSRMLLLPVITIAALIGIWQGLVTLLDVPITLAPGPADVVKSIHEHWGALLHQSWITLVEIILGFGLSVAVGVPLAVLIVASKTLEQLIYPVLVIAQLIPKVAIAPLFVIWMGFGVSPKVLIALLIAFFPVVIFTVVGLESADAEMLQMVRSMGGSRTTMFVKIRFPQALPSMFGGFRVAITLAVIGAVVGEFVGSNSGLGYLILSASGNLDSPFMFAAIFFLTVIGVVLYYLIQVLGRLSMPWYRTAEQGRPASGESRMRPAMSGSSAQ